MSHDRSASEPLMGDHTPGTSTQIPIELRAISGVGDDSRVSFEQHPGPSRAHSASSVSGSSTPIPATSTSHLNSSLTIVGAAIQRRPTSSPLPPQKEASVPNGLGGNGVPLSSSTPGRSILDILKLWKGELAAALFAVLLMAVEIILFVHYDQKFLFTHHHNLSYTATWPFHFHVNAVFALTNAFIDAALMFCIAACIGQLRWHWFKNRAHRMDWLDIMTNARGAPGAARMLFKKAMYRQYATAGAVGILLLLFTSFFTQQAVTLVPRPYPPEGQPRGGRVPIQTAYDWYGKGVTLDLSDDGPTSDMLAAIQSGFDSIASTTQYRYSSSAITYCNGTKCEYGKYRSLGVCGTCSSDSLPVVNTCSGGSCTDSDYYTLANPHGVDLSLSAINGLINLTADLEYPVSQDLNDEVGPLIVRLTALLRKWNVTSEVVASECAAWWCVKTYASNMTNGTLHEHLVDEWTDQSQEARTTGSTQRASINLQPPSCSTESESMAVPPDCNYWVGAISHRGIQNFLATSNPNVFGSPFLQGSGTTNSNSSTFNVTSLPVNALTGASSYIAYPALLTQAFETMLDYMTVDLRDSTTAGSKYPGWQSGMSFTNEQAFETEWPWLTLPFFVLVATLIFLALTMFVSRHDEIWKSSTMALMFHAFNDEDRKALKDLNTAQSMARNTRDLVVQLEPGPSGQWIFKTKQRRIPHGEKYDVVREKGSTSVGHIVEIAAGTLNP